MSGAPPLRVAILGGGNGAFAAAADLVDAGHEVRLWRRDAAAVADHHAQGRRVAVRYRGERHEVTLNLVTTDIAAAVDGADLILCITPATAQADIAPLLAPHLRDGQVVFLPPGTLGSVLFAKAQHDAGNLAITSFAETGTLPWLARKKGPFEVAITLRATRLPTGVFPACRADHALAIISRAFPGVIEPCGDALSGALMNAGGIIHPPLIIMNAGPLEHFPAWDIHNEGTTAAIRRVTDALDHERIAIRGALGYPAPHFPLADNYAPDGDEWMYGRANHKKLTDSGDWREHIVLTEHRYMREDTQLGLSLLVSCADLAGVAAPLVRAFAAIGSAICGVDFLTHGRSLGDVGLGGLNRAALAARLDQGFA
jgi:opine dehydrogenase